MKTRIAAAAALAGSLLLIPIALDSANAGRGGGFAEAAWAASTLVEVVSATSVESATSAEAISVILMEVTLAEWVVPILPMLVEWVVVAGTVGPYGTATTGTVIGRAMITITSSMTTITSTTASSVSDSAGGLPTMGTVTAMVDVRGCAAKLSLPGAPIGGTATPAVRTYY